MAKVKAALKALDAVLDDLPTHIASLGTSSGLKCTLIELEFTGSLAIDKEGGVDAGGETANVLEVASGGAPVSIKAGFGSKWDNTGGASWKLAVKFG